MHNFELPLDFDNLTHDATLLCPFFFNFNKVAPFFFSPPAFFTAVITHSLLSSRIILFFPSEQHRLPPINSPPEPAQMRDDGTPRKSRRDGSSPHRKRKLVSLDDSDSLDDSECSGNVTGLDDSPPPQKRTKHSSSSRKKRHRDRKRERSESPGDRSRKHDSSEQVM